MTYATSAQLSASERFFLVKIEPRKYLGLGTHVTGNTYTFSTTLPRVDAVHLDGSTSGITSFSLSNGVLTVVSPSNLASASFTVTADFYQFYTGSKVRDTAGNTAGLPEEIWEPYITNYPQFSQSMRSIADGVFSIANTQLDLISENRLLHGYFGDDYSWANAPVTVWSCIDEVNTCRLVFTGTVASANLTSSSVSLSVLDSFQRLNQSATFGTKSQSFIYTGNSNSLYPNAQDDGQVMPLVIGESSPLFVKNTYRHLDTYGSMPTTMYHLSDGLRAIKRTPEAPSETSQVSFIAGRIVGGDIKKLNFGTISAGYRYVVFRDVRGDYGAGATADPEIWTQFIFVQCSSFNGEIGDFVSSFTVNGSDFHGWVCRKTPFTYLGTDYDFAICCSEFGEVPDSEGAGSVPSNGSVTVVIANNSIPSMSAWIEGGDGVENTNIYIPLALVPSVCMVYHNTRYLKIAGYTLDTAYTIGGQSVRQLNITIDPADTDLVDSRGAGSSVLASATIKCRFSSESSVSHGDALKFVIKAAGMDVNNSSFSDADTFLDANVNICIPETNATDFPSYLEVAQSITSSTLGIIRVNESRECEYHILDDLKSGSSVGTRDVVNMIDGKTSVAIDYQDTYTAISFENPTYKGIESSSSSSGPNAIVSNPIGSALNRMERVKEIKHVLTDIYTRTDAMLDLYTSPKVEYTFSTASDDLTTEIGDVLTIDNPSVASESQTMDGVVVDVQTSGRESTVTINELRGL